MVEIFVDDDANGSSHVAVAIAPIPNMPCPIGFIAAAVMLMLIAKLIHFPRAVGRADSDAPEGRLQGF